MECFDQVIADLHMMLHHLALWIGQMHRASEELRQAWLVSDVVQPRSHAEVPEVLLQASDGVRNFDGIPKHPA